MWLWNLLTSTTNWFYGIFSGWFGDVTIVTGFTISLYTYWKHTRCHVEGCNRHGKYSLGHYKLCHVHHPDVPSHGRILPKHITDLHQKLNDPYER